MSILSEQIQFPGIYLEYCHCTHVESAVTHREWMESSCTRQHMSDQMLNPPEPEGFVELSVGVRQLVERTGAVVKEIDFCAVVLVIVKHLKTM